MSFRTDLLATIEDVRRIPGELDIRQWRVFVIKKTWSGARVGLGTATTTETELLVSGYPPRVREVSQRDVALSGGLYVSGDLQVGPLTPSHASGGVSVELHDPTPTASPTQLLFRVEGPGLPADGALYERVYAETMKNFSHTLVIRSTARKGVAP